MLTKLCLSFMLVAMLGVAETPTSPITEAERLSVFRIYTSLLRDDVARLNLEKTIPIKAGRLNQMLEKLKTQCEAARMEFSFSPEGDIACAPPGSGKTASTEEPPK